MIWLRCYLSAIQILRHCAVKSVVPLFTPNLDPSNWIDILLVLPFSRDSNGVYPPVSAGGSSPGVSPRAEIVAASWVPYHIDTT